MATATLSSALVSERRALAATDGVVLTLGTFDGVHRGHQALLREARAAADARGAALVAVTFDPLPRTVLGRGQEPPLVTVERRVQLLHAHGADVVDVLHFDRAVAAVEYQAFVDELLRRYPVRHAVLGYDFALGRDRFGTADRLAALGVGRGYTVQTEPPVLDADGEPISSSRIRQRILAGDVVEAARLLGRPVTITGGGDEDGLLDVDGGVLIRNAASRHMLPAPGTYSAVLSQGGGAIPVSVVVEEGDAAAAGRRVWRTILPFDRASSAGAGEYTLQLTGDDAASAHAVTGSSAGYW